MYNVDTKWKEIMRFLQLNQIDTYNYSMSMSNIDVADQLRVFYCIFGHITENWGG